MDSSEPVGVTNFTWVIIINLGLCVCGLSLICVTWLYEGVLQKDDYRLRTTNSNFFAFSYRIAYGFCSCYQFIWFTACCCCDYRKTLRYMKIIKNNSLVRLNLTKYYLDFCMDSDYPDQIKFNKINGRDNFTMESGPVTLAKSFKKRNATFELGQMPGCVQTRFIQLLPSVTLTYFSFSSKNIYYQCLDMRGLEYSYYYCHDDCPRQRYNHLSKNGRRMGLVRNFTPGLHRFVVCFDTFKWTAGMFYKTYRKLVLHANGAEFDDTYHDWISTYFHDGLKALKLTLYRRENNWIPSTAPKLCNFLTFLKLCETVQKFGISFDANEHEFVHVPPLSISFDSDPDFAVIRSKMEEWFSTRPDLQFFKLVYNHNGFLLHKNELKYMYRLGYRRWYLLEDYDVENWGICKKKHSKFFRELRSPYTFKPADSWYYSM